MSDSDQYIYEYSHSQTSRGLLYKVQTGICVYVIIFNHVDQSAPVGLLPSRDSSVGYLNDVIEMSDVIVFCFDDLAHDAAPRVDHAIMQ